MAKYKGAYPNGFLKRVDKIIDSIGLENPRVLHLFSGSIQGREGEDTMDIQKQNNPSIVADATKEFPIEDNTYDVILADPPYDIEEKGRQKTVKIDWSTELWGTAPVKPYSFVKEAMRVLKPGGLLFILHFLVYKRPKGALPASFISVTTGPNTRVRMLCIFKKTEDGTLSNLLDNLDQANENRGPRGPKAH